MEATSAAGRREAVARRWPLPRGVTMVAAGLPVPIAGTDQFHDFHAHPEFRYLTGLEVAGAVLAFDPGEGWCLFAPVAGEEARIWEGDGRSLSELATMAGIDRVRPVAALGSWLERRRGEPVSLLGNEDLVRLPAAYGVPEWVSLELAVDVETSQRLSEVISEARRIKDAAELAAMRLAAEASRQGHLAGLRSARPGVTERSLQVEIEAAFFRAGAARTAYGSIVGGGPNAAVLHFMPSARPFRDGDLILVDAGAEIDGYASDVTRTFPAGARFDGIHRDLYALLLAVQQQAIGGMRPGVEYRELHLQAARGIAAGLVELGILRGSPDGLVERDAHALFFPHGLGHMLGLATHDAGGCLAGRTPSDRFGLKWLRADLPLEAGYVLTIEPGIYFIPALLESPAWRERFKDAVDWARVDALGPLGGLRIEDDVLVTPEGSAVLTEAIPKTIAELEALRAEGLAAAPGGDAGGSA